MSNSSFQEMIAKLRQGKAEFTPRERLQYQLEEVEAAISAILMGAQSYSIAGQSLTRANLGDLLKFKRQLVTSLSGGGLRFGTFSFARSNRRGR